MPTYFKNNTKSLRYMLKSKGPKTDPISVEKALILFTQS